MLKAVWRLTKRILAWLYRVPAENCTTLDPMQQYMLDSEAEWQIAFLEYCWQLDASRHYLDR